MQNESNPAATTPVAKRRQDMRKLVKLERNLFEREGRFLFIAQDSRTGKQIKRTLEATTRTDARVEASDLRAKLAKGEVGREDRSLTVEQLAQLFIEHERSPLGRRAATTVALNEQVIRSHVTRLLGPRTRVADVRVQHVRKMLDSLTAEGKSGSTVRNVNKATSAMFRYAARDLGAITRNPCRDLERGDLPSAARKSEPRYLSLRQIELLLSKLSKETRPVAAAMFYAALRVSEALALRWSDVDTEAGVIRVPGTKTKASKASVPLHPALARELNEHRRRMMALGFERVRPDALIFQTTTTGKAPTRRNVLRAIAAAGVRAGLQPEGAQPIGCHDLRHSAAAAAFSLRWEPAKVAALLRHATPAVTMKVYAGLSDEAVVQLGNEWAAVGSAS